MFSGDNNFANPKVAANSSSHIKQALQAVPL